MEHSPIYNQMFVGCGVLSTILSCGLGLGFLPFLQDSYFKNHNLLHVDDKHLSYIETAGELAFIPSILIIPLTMQKKGTRMASIVTIMPILLSWLMSFNTGNFLNLLVVNVLHNVSLGGAISISSIIISELCSPKYRGVFLMIEAATISLGVLLCHISAMLPCWEIISCLGLTTSITALLIAYFSPESPYWLISKGYLVKGRETFCWLRGQDEDAMNELNNLLRRQKIKMQLSSLRPIRSVKLREKITECLRSLLTADFFKPLSIMLLLFSFVSVVGENFITNYSLRNVFMLKGKYVSTIIFDVITLICSLTACLLIQIVKRTSLFCFLGSFSLMLLVLTSLSMFLQILDLFLKEYLWVLLSLATGFVMFTSLGTTALPVSLLGDIFPMSYKGVGSSLTCTYVWAFGNSILKLDLPLIITMGIYKVIAITVVVIFGILMTLSIILPDTDLKSMIEIDKLIKLHEDGQYRVAINEVKDIDLINDRNLFLIV